MWSINKTWLLFYIHSNSFFFVSLNFYFFYFIAIHLLAYKHIDTHNRYQNMAFFQKKAFHMLKRRIHRHRVMLLKFQICVLYFFLSVFIYFTYQQHADELGRWLLVRWRPDIHTCQRHVPRRYNKCCFNEVFCD